MWILRDAWNYAINICEYEKSPNVCEPHYTTVGQWNVVTKSNLDYLKEA